MQLFYYRLRLYPEDGLNGSRHACIGEIRRPVREYLRIRRAYMGVSAYNCTDSAVRKKAERAFFARCLRVEVNKNALYPVIFHLFDFFVKAIEGVYRRVFHKRRAHEIDDPELFAAAR